MRWLVLVCCSGCVPYAMAPVKAEVGATTRLAEPAAPDEKPALHAAAGVHLASAQPSAPPFDLGIGWIMERADGASAHGGYVDAAWFIDRTALSRASLGVRGELRWLDGERIVAAKLRVDIELFAAGAGAIPHGRYRGASAIGLFFELGRAWSVDDTWLATFGLAFRLPGAAGFYP